MKQVIGLIVNPVAGMGGSIGLKGTDDEMYKKALQMGAEPVTPKRTADFIARIQHKDEITVLVAPDKMGEQYIKSEAWSYAVIGSIEEETSAEDTRRIAQEMVERKVALLVFIGGDGTARDIYDAIGDQVPVIAVPSGVKVFSSVFALSARAAAEMLDAFIEGTDLTEEEVMDIDEDAFRDNRLAAKLYGYLKVPEVHRFLQPAKAASSVGQSDRASKEDIAAFIVEKMEPETLYLLGPGTTVRSITDEMGLPKTLLGVDAVLAGKTVGTDLNENGILALLGNIDKKKIVVTPIGGSGFIFGRGSKQFTPEVIKKVGRENIIVVGTRDKVKRLACLHVDTGDEEVDDILRGYMEVMVGYGAGIMVEVQ